MAHTVRQTFFGTKLEPFGVTYKEHPTLCYNHGVQQVTWFNTLPTSAW